MPKTDESSMDLAFTPADMAQYLAFKLRARQNTLIVSAPGIGKSEIVTQTTAELIHDDGKPFDLMLSHPVTSDPTDYKGLPYARDGRAEWLPYGDLRRLIETTRPLVCFLDDIGQAAPATQAALMQLVQARAIGDHKVSPYVSFVAATNRKEDKAAVSHILEPVKSRFNIVHMVPNLDDWCSWALSNNIAWEVVAFARFRPGLIADGFKPTSDMKNSPSPRTMAAAGRTFALGLPSHLRMAAFAGDIGSGAAAELCSFLDTFARLPNLDSILMNPAGAPVPEGPAERFAVATGLARKATAANIDRVIAYAERLPDEYNVLLVTDARRLNKDQIKRDPTTPNLETTAHMLKWIVKYSSVMA